MNCSIFRHEVPFFQPLTALEIFERAINGKDIATGKVYASPGYLTQGPKQSTYREGNPSIESEVLPANATYNITTGLPNVERRTELLNRRPGMLSHVGKKFKA